MMYRLLSIFLTVTLFPCMAWGQLTAQQAFVNAPLSQFPSLKKMTRMDMIDYFNSGSDRQSENSFGGFSRIMSLTPSRLVVEDVENCVVTELSTERMKGRDSVIICIKNYSTPAVDGKVELFDSNWNMLEGKRFAEPLLKEWIKKGTAKEDVAEVMSLVPFAMARYSYDPDTHLLTLTGSFGELLPEEDYKKVGGWLYTQLTYKWTGKKFTLQSRQ